MSLLKIQEKALSNPKPLAVGIDLGTTHSLLAYEEKGTISFLKDEKSGSSLMPSVVHYAMTGEVIVGHSAQSQLMTAPDQTIYSVKRLMGRSLEEINQQGMHFPYRFVDQKGLVHIQLQEQIVNPVEVSAEILKALMQQARATHPDIFQAVITVPAYFDEPQRQATWHAAKLAGIEVLRLINEPTAAAIAYGLDHNAERLCLVYDLGGGTFDVSLLKVEKGVLEVLGIGGIAHLGGDDFDQRLADLLKTKSDLPPQAVDLRTEARRIKEKLSFETKVMYSLAGKEITITRTEFERLTRPLIQQTVEVVEGVLRDAKLSHEDIQDVLLVGGATRMPAISEILNKIFPEKIRDHLDPDRVVAQGAAIQASRLSGHRKDGQVLLDVIPLSLGVEVMGGLTEKIILRNTKMPCRETQHFTTYQEGQTGLSLHVVQGERELSKDCRSLAHFDLTGIPSMPAGQAKIEVAFQVDADGLLSVTARELQSDVHAEITIKPTFGLTSEAIQHALLNSISHAQTDLKERRWIEKANEANHFLQLVEKAWSEYERFLTSDQAQAILENLMKLKAYLSERAPMKMLDQLLETLEKQLAPAMQQRLQWVLDQTVTGRSITEINSETFSKQCI